MLFFATLDAFTFLWVDSSSIKDSLAKMPTTCIFGWIGFTFIFNVNFVFSILMPSQSSTVVFIEVDSFLDSCDSFVLTGEVVLLVIVSTPHVKPFDHEIAVLD